MYATRLTVLLAASRSSNLWTAVKGERPSLAKAMGRQPAILERNRSADSEANNLIRGVAW